MTLHLPPDPEVSGWLHTLGVTSLCEWEVLVFCYNHKASLLSVADFARLLGQASNAIVSALDALESRVLIVRSRVSQGARLYQFSVPLDSPRGAAFGRLLTLAHHPEGLTRVVQQLRQGPTPEEAGAPCGAAAAPPRLQGIGQQADEDAARRNQWLKAI